MSTTISNGNNGNNALLKVRDLKTYFRTEDGTVKAVDGVSFDLHRGETLGIVGESGSGKSVTNLSILRLIPQPPGEVAGGEVIFEGKDLLKMPEKDLRDIRGGQIAMIFQDPMTSLNPFMRVSSQLMEVTRLHLGYGRKQAREHAVRMLELVGIPDAKSRVDDYPHQFSGGMRQRVMIAMALACRPKLLIADEPTTALDVTIQAQILELIKEMKEETGTSVILITHDLGLVAGMTDHVVVMYAGHVFETAPTAELFRNPQNPYTRALLRSVPDPTREGEELFQIAGLPPDLARLSPDRCPFAERCPEVIDMCREAFPPYHKVDDDHWTLCWVR
jgi:oligopeptide transport system ATP-binding protein